MAAVTGAAFFYLGCRADKLFPHLLLHPFLLTDGRQKRGETGAGRQRGIFVPFVTRSYSCYFLMSGTLTHSADRSFGGGINLSPSDQFICEPACVFHVIKP